MLADGNLLLIPLCFSLFSQTNATIKGIGSLAEEVNLHIILTYVKFEYILVNWKVESMKMMPSGTEKESR